MVHLPIASPIFSILHTHTALIQGYFCATFAINSEYQKQFLTPGHDSLSAIRGFVLINRTVLLHPVPLPIYQPSRSQLAARRRHHIFSPSICQVAVMYMREFLEPASHTEAGYRRKAHCAHPRNSGLFSKFQLSLLYQSSLTL